MLKLNPEQVLGKKLLRFQGIKMKYLIAYLVKGKVERYQKNLMKNISNKFNVKNINKKIYPHVTLKSPFETDDISELNERLKNFVKINSSPEVYINGFGNFDNSVLYLNVEFSEKAKEFFRKMKSKLSDLDYINFDEYDELENNFHSTVAIIRDRNKFDEIKQILLSRNPKYNLKLDNVSILKKETKRWKLHKMFNLK